MPNRIIREAILSSEKVCSLGWPEEVFYRRLMSIVDDYGRCEASEKLLRSRCYPLQTDDVRVADISRWLAACQKSGLILVYAVEGKQYVEVANFQQQQRSPSKWPAPPANASKCSQAPADAHLVVVVDEGVSGGGGVSEARKRAVAPLPDWIPPESWEAWLKFRGKSLTAHGRTLCIAELAKLMAEGNAPKDVIEQSIRNGWKGLFEVKRGGPRAQQQTERARVAAEIYGTPDEQPSERVIDGEAHRVA